MVTLITKARFLDKTKLEEQYKRRKLRVLSQSNSEFLASYKITFKLMENLRIAVY